MPGGSFAIHRNPAIELKPVGRSTLTSKGHVFAIEWADEALHHYQAESGAPQKLKPADFWISFDDAENFLRKTLQAAATFYGQIELPGYLLASIGYLDVRYYRMYRNQRPGDSVMISYPIRGQQFPDQQFRADVTMQAAEFVSAPDNVVRQLLDQLAFGFDLPPIP
jgi:hypothetical protein